VFVVLEEIVGVDGLVLGVLDGEEGFCGLAFTFFLVCLELFVLVQEEGFVQSIFGLFGL
jgi:hypothetical protein